MPLQERLLLWADTGQACLQPPDVRCMVGVIVIFASHRGIKSISMHWTSWLPPFVGRTIFRPPRLSTTSFWIRSRSDFACPSDKPKPSQIHLTPAKIFPVSSSLATMSSSPMNGTALTDSWLFILFSSFLILIILITVTHIEHFSNLWFVFFTSPSAAQNVT